MKSLIKTVIPEDVLEKRNWNNEYITSILMKTTPDWSLLYRINVLNMKPKIS
jgi:hypothetical protein